MRSVLQVCEGENFRGYYLVASFDWEEVVVVVADIVDALSVGAESLVPDIAVRSATADVTTFDAAVYAGGGIAGTGVAVLDFLFRVISLDAPPPPPPEEKAESRFSSLDLGFVPLPPSIT